jgi:hypothetical protein
MRRFLNSKDKEDVLSFAGRGNSTYKGSPEEHGSGSRWGSCVCIRGDLILL